MKLKMVKHQTRIIEGNTIVNYSSISATREKEYTIHNTIYLQTLASATNESKLLFEYKQFSIKINFKCVIYTFEQFLMYTYIYLYVDKILCFIIIIIIILLLL